MIGLFVILAGALSLGLLIVCALGNDLRARLEFWAFAFGVGLGSLVYSHFLLAWASFPLNQQIVVGMCLLAFGGVVYWGTRRGLSVSRQWTVPRPKQPLEWLVVVGLAFFTVCLFLTIFTTPLKSFDSRMIWSFHARLIFDTGTYPTPELRDPAFVIGHPQYPFLIPMGEALISFVDGAFDERFARLIPFAFYLGTVAVLLVEIPQRNPRWGLLLTGAYALMPMLVMSEEGGSDSGLADVAVGFYVLIGAVVLDRIDRRPEAWKSSILAGLCLAFAGLTKNEGLVLGGLLCVDAWRRQQLSFKEKIVLSVAWLLPLVPWLVVRSGLATLFEERYTEHLTPTRLLWGFGRTPSVLDEMMRQMFLMPQRAGIFWWVITVWLVTARQLKKLLWDSRLWVVGVYLGIVFVLYLVTPWEENFQVILSFSRVLLHVAPLALLEAARFDGTATDRPVSDAPAAAL